MKRFLCMVLIGAMVSSIGSSVSAQTTNNDILQREHTVSYLEDKNKLSQYDLPVIEINTEGGKPIVSKDDYLNATMVINGSDEFTQGLYDGDIQIRGRGNSTWGHPKKPYKIKLGKKAGLLGMEEGKEWVLLANYADKTLIRSRLAFDIATEMGLEYTSESRYVEIILNDEYVGNYLLCEQTEVKENRVEIDELKDSDTDPEVITGGYLIEVDFRRDADTWYYTDLIKAPITFKSPKVPNKEQYNYIRGYINELEQTLVSKDFTANGKHYSDYIDLDSFIDYYLVNEVFKNFDAPFRSSVNMYKPRNEKIHMGPIWDFDISCGNANYKDFLPEYKNESPEGWWMRYSSDNWYLYLFEDPEFVEKVQDRFWELIDLFESMPSKIDEYAKTLDNSQKLNFKRWDILDKWVTPNVVVMGSYEGEVEYLKNWLTTRIEWMKKNMGNQPEKPKNIFDLNNDFKVNIGDLSIFSKNYGEYNTKMDFNKDNKVNDEDLQMLVNEILK